MDKEAKAISDILDVMRKYNLSIEEILDLFVMIQFYAKLEVSGVRLPKKRGRKFGTQVTKKSPTHIAYKKQVFKTRKTRKHAPLSNSSL